MLNYSVAELRIDINMPNNMKFLFAVLQNRNKSKRTKNKTGTNHKGFPPHPLIATLST